MIHRMVAATLALTGLLLSLYLWLWKIGALGVLACGDGGCETVQMSEFAVVFGVPVAFFGVIGYAVLLAVAIWGLQERWLASPLPSRALAIFAGIGVLFTGYLTYLEAFVIHAWCRWCLVSAAIIVALFMTSLVGLAGKPSGEGLPES